MALLPGDFCDVNHCQNGGTCLTGINETPFFCICPEGYVGIDCNETEKGEGLTPPGCSVKARNLAAWLPALIVALHHWPWGPALLICP